MRCAVAGGLRGLVASRDARVGDVLLEVPLTAALADGAGPEPGLEPAGPSWSTGLLWNVQLALGLLSRRDDPRWSPFLSSWPEDAPLLPKDMDSEELEAAEDEDFEVRAEQTYFWLEEQYEVAREAHEAANAADAFPSEEEFRWAMAHVWSRCIRLELGEQQAARRFLVPVMDLANHEPFPYKGGGACHSDVRRALQFAFCPVLRLRARSQSPRCRAGESV